jgi:hypothetical protein
MSSIHALAMSSKKDLIALHLVCESVCLYVSSCVCADVHLHTHTVETIPILLGIPICLDSHFVFPAK